MLYKLSCFFFFSKQKTAYEMRISDWSSDVCSSDLLERAADIKRESVQVVDAIVAQDIGKLPDPTTAAALQRVPGVQVSTNRNNELGDVRVRGLPDVLTTVNGREVFTTTGRSEEHTSELQSLMRISYAVFCLKKK